MLKAKISCWKGSAVSRMPATQALKRRAGLFLLLALILSACFDPNPAPFEFQQFGTTMGTTFSIKIPKLSEGIDPAELKKEINDTLIRVNSTLSTYQADSELSKLNQNPSTGWIAISAQLAEVLDE
ncbi:FAD:protein FMN transferase, partial [bacterium]|nr:FAD:protein FMN transferase [bacterium]